MNPATALLDVRRMEQADRLSVAAGISVGELMENAGRAVAQEILRRWTPRPVIVLCGPGNNGGDGFVTARHLADARWPVRVALLGARAHLRGAALENANRWPGAIEDLGPETLGSAAVVVDAIFGAGLNRALEGPARDTLARAAADQRPIVAIDVPSGLDGDTGESLGAVAAALTVTFLRKKPGHLLLPGREICGELVVADIGTPAAIVAQVAPNSFENDPLLWFADLPRPHNGGNKFNRGHALLYGGYPITGAARMAARAAARSGAGLTTVAVPAIALPIYAAALTSIMVAPLGGPEDFVHLLGDPRINAFLIGPGAGVSEETHARVLALLATGRATVIDADAITVFRNRTAELAHSIRGPCVLTPHEGEFSRLFDAAGDKLTRARAAAATSGAVIVLKGSDTVIAAPDGRAIVNANAPPTLATAGSGDVLGGIVLGLLAQAMDHFLAAAAAVWIHGAAAALFGPGLLAEDLPDLLPRVLRGLEGGTRAGADA
jgi:NAD(P)H-hydrate epimerase